MAITYNTTQHHEPEDHNWKRRSDAFDIRTFYEREQCDLKHFASWVKIISLLFDFRYNLRLLYI
jgi:hypothetical protein